jgi:hypothetical protein
MPSVAINRQFAEGEAIIQNILNSEELQKLFATYGFPLRRIKDGETRLKAAREFQQLREELAESQYDANQQWKDDYQQAKRSYQEYVTLVRMVYRKQPEVLRKLHIHQPVPTTQQEWLDQARLFYTKAPAYIAPLEERFGLKPEEWSQALVEIHALISAKHRRLQHKAHAQRATQQRDEALAELIDWIRELKYIARVALKSDPQLQEALGMVVK